MADDLVLLWQLAHEMKMENGQSQDANWLMLMDAFWRGDFAQNGLTLWQDDPSNQGGELFPGLTRADLAEAAFGQAKVARLGVDEACRKLLDWNVGDYQKVREMLRYYFSVQEEKRGLAVSRAEYDRWRTETARRRPLVPPGGLVSQRAQLKKNQSNGKPSVRQRPAFQTAVLAITVIWPKGIPPTERAKTRDRKIVDWCKIRKPPLLAPSRRVIRRAVQELDMAN